MAPQRDSVPGEEGLASTLVASEPQEPTVDVNLTGGFPDRYEIEDLIGRGGMGEVHSCRDGRVGRLIAMMLAGFVLITLLALDRSGVMAVLLVLAPLGVGTALCFLLARQTRPQSWAAVSALLFVWRLSRNLSQLRDRIQLFSWQFGQIVPEEARRGLPEE